MEKNELELKKATPFLIVFLIVSLALLTFFSLQMIKTYTFLYNADKATGTVIGSECCYNRFGSDGGFSVATIEFLDSKNNKNQFKSNLNAVLYPIDKSVDVYYLESDPKQAKAKQTSLLFGPILFVILTLIFTILGFIGVYQSIFKRKSFSE